MRRALSPRLFSGPGFRRAVWPGLLLALGGPLLRGQPATPLGAPARPIMGASFWAIEDAAGPLLLGGQDGQAPVVLDWSGIPLSEALAWLETKTGKRILGHEQSPSPTITYTTGWEPHARAPQARPLGEVLAQLHRLLMVQGLSLSPLTADGRILRLSANSGLGVRSPFVDAETLRSPPVEAFYRYEVRPTHLTPEEAGRILDAGLNGEGTAVLFASGPPILVLAPVCQLQVIVPLLAQADQPGQAAKDWVERARDPRRRATRIFRLSRQPPAQVAAMLAEFPPGSIDSHAVAADGASVAITGVADYFPQIRVQLDLMARAAAAATPPPRPEGADATP